MFVCGAKANVGHLEPAAALAGLSEVPVLVRELVGASDSLELALVENLQRSDLDPIEAARGYQRLQQNYGYTQEEVAQRVVTGIQNNELYIVTHEESREFVRRRFERIDRAFDT